MHGKLVCEYFIFTYRPMLSRIRDKMNSHVSRTYTFTDSKHVHLLCYCFSSL